MAGWVTYIKELIKNKACAVHRVSHRNSLRYAFGGLIPKPSSKKSPPSIPPLIAGSFVSTLSNNVISNMSRASELSVDTVRQLATIAAQSTLSTQECVEAMRELGSLYRTMPDENIAIIRAVASGELVAGVEEETVVEESSGMNSVVIGERIEDIVESPQNLSQLNINESVTVTEEHVEDLISKLNQGVISTEINTAMLIDLGVMGQRWRAMRRRHNPTLSQWSMPTPGEVRISIEGLMFLFREGSLRPPEYMGEFSKMFKMIPEDVRKQFFNRSYQDTFNNSDIVIDITTKLFRQGERSPAGVQFNCICVCLAKGKEENGQQYWRYYLLRKFKPFAYVDKLCFFTNLFIGDEAIKRFEIITKKVRVIRIGQRFKKDI